MINDTAIAKFENKLKARKRHYPKFVEGMSTADYVHQYYGLNAARWTPVSFGLQRGAYTAGLQFEQLRRQVNDFFEPLSTNPQFTPIDQPQE